MKKEVLLSITGRQAYRDQAPDTIELVTEGTMEYCNGGWDICYDESALTGLEGVTTMFRVEPDKIILTRSGRLHSQMIFREGQTHESLYQMEFGALMISVCASRIFVQLGQDGGMVDLVYNIDIEHGTGGTVDYHLDIRAK